ncbi:MAG TPA: hypothetical protein VFO52_12385 [Longimicrobiales bacterium]|nr:hypothetical protein [Longimicrobiales bacterium]
MRATLRAVVGAFFLLAGAQNLSAQQDTAQINELKRQMEALSREIEALRLGSDVVVQADTSAYGLGPAASKVYRVRQGVSVGGYGEVLYQNFAQEREDDAPSALRDQVDALRLILYVGYKFTDKLLLNSEIEFEHGTTGQGGEASVEFAYLDYRHSDAIGLRAGMLLVPMGLLNELHEPPIFLGTTRPETENAIIPSTWRENGFGVFGELGAFSYRAYVVNGFDAIGTPGRASGFSAGGLRGGRQKGAQALIEDPAVVVRADLAPSALRGLMVGGSAYFGKSGQSAQTTAGADIDAGTRIFEGHAQYRAHGLDLRALFALATVDDAALINERRGLTGNASVGEELNGYYVQGGFDILSLTNSTQQLTPYVRFEKLNTQAEVPAGFAANPATDRQVTVLGAEWKPITSVVLKADYQMHKNEAATGVNRFNIALGYLF